MLCGTPAIALSCINVHLIVGLWRCEDVRGAARLSPPPSLYCARTTSATPERSTAIALSVRSSTSVGAGSARGPARVVDDGRGRCRLVYRGCRDGDLREPDRLGAGADGRRLVRAARDRGRGDAS